MSLFEDIRIFDRKTWYGCTAGLTYPQYIGPVPIEISHAISSRSRRTAKNGLAQRSIMAFTVFLAYNAHHLYSPDCALHVPLPLSGQ